MSFLPLTPGSPVWSQIYFILKRLHHRRTEVRADAQHSRGIGALSAGGNKTVFRANVLRLRDDLDIYIAHSAPDCTGPAILTPFLYPF